MMARDEQDKIGGALIREWSESKKTLVFLEIKAERMSRVLADVAAFLGAAVRGDDCGDMDLSKYPAAVDVSELLKAIRDEKDREARLRRQFRGMFPNLSTD